MLTPPVCRSNGPEHALSFTGKKTWFWSLSLYLSLYLSLSLSPSPPLSFSRSPLSVSLSFFLCVSSLEVWVPCTAQAQRYWSRLAHISASGKKIWRHMINSFGSGLHEKLYLSGSGIACVLSSGKKSRKKGVCLELMVDRWRTIFWVDVAQSGSLCMKTPLIWIWETEGTGGGWCE